MSPEKLDKYAQAYGKAIESNRPFKWSEIAPGIDKYQRRQVRQYARDQGYVTTAPVNAQGHANFDGHYYNQNGQPLDNVSLPQNLWNSHKETQFLYLNQTVLGVSKTPAGYTWHHTETPGRMQLVEYGIHLATDHVGGSEIGGWAHRR